MWGAFVVALITAIAQSHQAREQQQEAEKFRQRQEAQARRLAAEQARLAAAEIANQQIADTQQASVEIETNRRQASAAKATATVTAGEVGAFGHSYEALIADFSRQQAEFEGAVESNLAIRNQNARISQQQAELGRRTAIFNAATPPIPKPNYLGIGLTAVNTGLSVAGSCQPGKNPQDIIRKRCCRGST